MISQNLFRHFFSLIFLIFYFGCTPTKQVELPKEEKKDYLIYPVPMGSEAYSLNLLMTNIIDNCQAKALKDQNSSIYVKHHTNYIHIDLNDESDFRNGSYVLRDNAKSKLSCIAPIIKRQTGLYIVVTGHANDHKKQQKNQHLSDDRAITLAELLFNAGVRDEIFAKGCSDKKSDPNNKDKYNKMIDRKIYIYIYPNKTDIINHCK